MKPRPPVDVLWCSNQRQGTSNRWSFPPKVERHLRALTRDQKVVHLFGGLSRFGTRMDIDLTVRPHVLADAWLPPFRADAFDVAIIDPPYVHLNQQMKQHLLRGAAFIASRHVIWFHTVWIASGGREVLTLNRSWLVRVGDSCAVRCLQVFDVQPGAKRIRNPHFTRGPAIRYNRWLAGQQRLTFEKQERPA